MGAIALVIWLEGPTTDPTQPYSGTGTQKSLYDFDTSRLISPLTGTTSTTPPQVYIPQNANNTPYVYTSAAYYLSASITDTSATTSAQLRPLHARRLGRQRQQCGLDIGSSSAEVGDTNSNVTAAQFQALCVNPKSFQLIASGPRRPIWPGQQVRQADQSWQPSAKFSGTSPTPAASATTPAAPTTTTSPISAKSPRRRDSVIDGKSNQSNRVHLATVSGRANGPPRTLARSQSPSNRTRH